MDFQDLKNLPVAELKELLAKEQARWMHERVKAHNKQLKQVHTMKQMRKTIARLTMLLAGKLQPKAQS